MDYKEDSDASEDDYDEKELQCGVGSYRPSYLQKCANMQLFTTIMSFWSLFGAINFSYYTAVITQIERAYGLSSAVSGFIKNVDNIGYLATVMIFSHFCRYSNKPRLFAGATVCSSAAIFIFALPHFIFGPTTVESQTFMNSTSSSNVTQYTAKPVEYCDGVIQQENEDFCRSYGSMKSIHTGALAIFIISEILQGLANSPKFTLSLTYMDDNAKNKSPRYFGELQYIFI